MFCVSERSLLAVVVPARRQDLPSGLGPAVADALARVGVDDSACRRELDAMTEHAVDRTRSRSVLGVVTDLAFSAELCLRDGMSPIELSVWLSRTPIKPLGYGSPANVTADLFASVHIPS